MIEDNEDTNGWHGKPGKVWEKYEDDYEKGFIDIRLKNGEEYGPCWPNAGMFNVLLRPVHTVNGDDVVKIRYREDVDARRIEG